MTKRKKEKVLLSSYCKNNGLNYLLEEWDYQNNNGKTPDDYTYGSKESVLWICNGILQRTCHLHLKRSHQEWGLMFGGNVQNVGMSTRQKCIHEKLAEDVLNVGRRLAQKNVR